MKKTLLITLSFLSVLVYSQEKTYIQIEGLVSDNLTNEPLPYSHLVVKPINIGTISNVDGKFILKYPKGKELNLIISQLGYESMKLNLNFKTDSVINFKLNQTNYSLSEIQVTPLSPKDIVRIAIEKIPENYGISYYNAKAFYREEFYMEHQDKEVEQILGVNSYGSYERTEAIMDIFKHPYMLNDSIKNKIILKAWRQLGGLADSTLKLFTGSGPHRALENDKIISLYKKFHNKPKKIKKYKFTLAETISYHDRLVFKIDYVYKNHKGSFYVDKDSYAFCKIVDEIANKKIKILFFGIDIKSNKRISTYSLIDSVWYFKSDFYEMDSDYIIYNTFLSRLLTNELKKFEQDVIMNTKHRTQILFSSIEKNSVIEFKDDALFSSETEIKQEIESENIDIWKEYNYIK